MQGTNTYIHTKYIWYTEKFDCADFTVLTPNSTLTATLSSTTEITSINSLGLKILNNSWTSNNVY